MPLRETTSEIIDLTVSETDLTLSDIIGMASPDGVSEELITSIGSFSSSLNLVRIVTTFGFSFKSLLALSEIRNLGFPY